MISRIPLILPLLFGLALRLLPRLVIPSILSQDAYFHLTMIRTVRRAGWKIARRKMLGYPLGFHIILSVLPSRCWVVLERFNSIVWDALQTAFFLLTLKYLAGIQSGGEETFGALLLFIAPAWVAVGLGPRAHHLTERVFGEFILTVTLGSLWFYSETGRGVWVLVALLASALLFNTSKFSAQVFLFFSLLLAVFRRDAVFIVVPLVGAGLALILSGGTYWVILREQTKHLLWYRQAVRDGAVPVAQRNSLRRAFQIGREEGFGGATKYVLQHHSLIIGILQHPALVVFAVWALRHGTEGVPPFPLEWILAAVVCWLMTSARSGLFLGEAERYLMHAVVPEYFLFVLLVIPAWPSAGWWVLAYSVLWNLAQIVVLKKLDRVDAEREPARRELIAFLRELPTTRFATFGTSVMWDLAYESEHEHFLLSSSNQFDWKELFSKYPFTRWAGVKRKGCELLVVERGGVERARSVGVGLDYPLDSCVLLFRNAIFTLYRLPASSAD